MATVCLQCGSNGFDFALIYCGDCKKFAIHCYCLEILPKSSDEDVVWFCEDCQPKHGKADTNEESCSPICEEDDVDFTELAPCTNNLKSFPPKRLGKRGTEKWMREKKRKKNKLKPQTGKDEKGGRLAEMGTVFTSETEVEKTKNVCRCQVYETQSSGNFDRAENTGKDIRATSGDVQNSKEEDESLKVPQSSKLDCPEQFGKGTYTFPLPIVDPVWRGSLRFNKEGINYFGRVVAHVSDLACSKVSEEAKLLPSLLCTELHPRPEVWPKGFKNGCPSDHNIALYIFADNKSEQEFFDSIIVEMIRKDLAMRAVVTNAELLVFTSTKLPFHLWRFQSKFYLWGVFKSKQPLPVSKIDSDTPVSEKDMLKTRSPGSPLSVGGSDGSSAVC